ncbi:MAG: DnaB-like helicase C-terminal domain-containing protein [Bacilli bacterium]
MNSKYIDIPSIIQVIGTIYQNPNLLDNDNYNFIEEDFTEEFHKILFGSIYNLHKLGAKEITLNTIEDYLVQRPKSYAIYQTNKGPEYLKRISENTQLSTFDYYYNRMKKMTLLRMYDDVGLDLSWIYDVDNILDAKKKQAQEDWLDNTSIEQIADIIDKKITEIKIKYAENSKDDYIPAGTNIIELIENLQKNPETGYPLFGPYINTVTRGARLKKFYLRSAATGVGKTRAMIADCCNIGCDEIYDGYEQKWKDNYNKEPALFITTEQEIDEIQTMMLAFLSDVDEGHIIYNNYEAGEYDRVIHAAEILKRCPVTIKRLPDFSLKDIENTIRYSIHENGTKYIFFDYLHTSMKILNEVTSKTGIKGLREDNVLFMISIKLKDLCNEYGVFIMTATQLNADYVTAQQYDQNLLRGAKSIADKIDCGMIMLQTSQEDKEALRPILAKGNFPEPGIKISVYKNRRGRYKDILLWCKANRATCRIEPMFATDYQYQIVEMPDLKIKINPKLTASAF